MKALGTNHYEGGCNSNIRNSIVGNLPQPPSRGSLHALKLEFGVCVGADFAAQINFFVLRGDPFHDVIPPYIVLIALLRRLYLYRLALSNQKQLCPQPLVTARNSRTRVTNPALPTRLIVPGRSLNSGYDILAFENRYQEARVKSISRRTDRVSLTLLLEISGTDSQGKEFRAQVRTLLLNRAGAIIVFEGELAAEQRLHIQRRAPSESQRQGEVRVVGQFGKQDDGYLYGVEIVDPSLDLWGVEFPSIAESPEAVARMLLECTHCGAHEVVHLNELELRTFEANRGIARYCKACGVPSIWTQAPHETEKKLSSRASRPRRPIDRSASANAAAEQRERRRVRLKTRLTACIRQTGSDDELAVCEDISPVGMCFRSKRRYAPDASVEVAVPYSPESANIFLPARIIYSEEMPKAGLFRHGTEYCKLGPPANN